MKSRTTLLQRLTQLYRKQGTLARNFLVANMIAIIGSLGATFWVLVSHLEH